MCGGEEGITPTEKFVKLKLYFINIFKKGTLLPRKNFTYFKKEIKPLLHIIITLIN